MFHIKLGVERKKKQDLWQLFWLEWIDISLRNVTFPVKRSVFFKVILK